MIRDQPLSPIPVRVTEEPAEKLPALLLSAEEMERIMTDVAAS